MWSNRWAERYRWSDTLYNNWENGIRDLIPKFITYSRYNLRYHILKKGINLIIALPRLIVSSRVLDLWLIYYRGREKTDNFQFIFVLYVRLESMKIRQQNFSRWENEVINKKHYLWLWIMTNSIEYVFTYEKWSSTWEENYAFEKYLFSFAKLFLTIAAILVELSSRQITGLNKSLAYRLSVE